MSAIGDVAGGPLLAHKATEQGIAAVEILAGIERPPLDLSRVPACIYSQPQVASVGLTEAEARAQWGDRVRVGKFPFAASGKAFMPRIEYGLKLPDKPICPVNPSGGLIACGHPVGATGLMQGVFAIWQLQGSIAKHFGDPALQLDRPKRGVIHSHAGTGTYVTVSILERED